MQQTTPPTPFDFPEMIRDWSDEFIKAKRIEGLSGRTIIFYRQQLAHFFKFCDENELENISQITTPIIRDYLLWLQDQGHNPGGSHAAYRSLKAFLRWFELEKEPAGWRNPINKVKAPKVSDEPIEPVEVSEVIAMVETCNDGSLISTRDKAIMLFLLDTGVRARELLALDIVDANMETGAVLVRKGKGRKPRTVFMGQDTMAALSAYLESRRDQLPALWAIDDGRNRLTYGGLLWMLYRRAELAKIKDAPSPHDFRRAFALNMLRNGVDLITLARLMGHTTLKVLSRYLAQIADDLQAAHIKGGPVDNAMRANRATMPEFANKPG